MACSKLVVAVDLVVRFQINSTQEGKFMGLCGGFMRDMGKIVIKIYSLIPSKSKCKDSDGIHRDAEDQKNKSKTKRLKVRFQICQDRSDEHACVDLLLKSLFCSPGPCVCFYVTTILFIQCLLSMR